MIISLLGPNSFLLNQELKELIISFKSKHGELALEQFDAEETNEAKITGALESLPFLASHKMIIVKNLSKNKDINEKIEGLIKQTSAQTDLIIVEPSPDKRSKYYKDIKKLTEFKEFPELDRIQLSRWAVEFAKHEGCSLSAGDAAYLLERIGANQQRLANEIMKLANYSPKIDRTSIDSLTEPTPQSTVFNLLDAALSGNQKKAISIYEEQRKQKVEPQAILGMIAWQLHILALVKAAEGKPADQIAKEAAINPFVVSKSQAIAKRLNMRQIKNLVTKALALDISSKTKSIDVDEALKNYLLEFTF